MLQLSKETHWRSLVWLLFAILTTYVGFAYSWAAALLCLWVSFVISFTTVFFPRCQWLCPVHCKTHQNTILITIDDGPDPTSTPVLLDLLDQYKTKAIFFMIGEKVLTHPELAREVIRRGHEIGNHTHTHPRDPAPALEEKKGRKDYTRDTGPFFFLFAWGFINHPSLGAPFGMVQCRIPKPRPRPSSRWIAQ